MGVWSVETLNATVDAEIEALPPDIRAKLLHIVRMIEAHGLDGMREPYAKHIEGKIWEMRMKGRSGIGRALYVTRTGRRVVVLHAFIKKTQKTPARALETARRRAKEVKT